MTGEKPELSEFRSLIGILPEAAIMFVLVWILAAFGEEMAYRGYVIDRGAALGGRSAPAYLIAMVVVSLLFGIGHYYQGVAGMISSAFSGLLFGSLYLMARRNLWLPILTHGVSDTLGLGYIYFGFVPDL